MPDLATNLGTVSKNGLTYTFHLKNGIKFGPPLNREITSKDILYAIERIGTPALVAQYGFYYNVIKGMTAFESGKSKVISGIQTPDPKTIIFHLTVPTGDFRYRLAMPAAGPIPQEVAGCFNAPNLYGRYLISSGPYMFAGSDKLDRDELRHDHGLRWDLGLRRHDQDGSRAEPRLQPGDGQPEGT